MFHKLIFHCFEEVKPIWEKFLKFKKIDDIIHFSNVWVGKNFGIKNVFQITKMIQEQIKKYTAQF